MKKDLLDILEKSEVKKQFRWNGLTVYTVNTGKRTLNLVVNDDKISVYSDELKPIEFSDASEMDELKTKIGIKEVHEEIVEKPEVSISEIKIEVNEVKEKDPEVENPKIDTAFETSIENPSVEIPVEPQPEPPIDEPVIEEKPSEPVIVEEQKAEPPIEEIKP